MSKKDIHIECYVRNAVSNPRVNGAYKLQERGHIHSKHTMFFKHENGIYSLARFKIGGKYGWVIGQDRKAIYGVRTEELYPPKQGWKTVARGTFSGKTVPDHKMEVRVIQVMMGKNKEETVYLNDPKVPLANKDLPKREQIKVMDVGGKVGDNNHMLSFASMDETVGNLHPRLDAYIVDEEGRRRVLYKEKIPLDIRTGQHCCSCCPARFSESDLPAEYGAGVEMYFQFLKWLYCMFFILFIVITPTLYIILKTGEYDETLTNGIGVLAIPTLGNLGEGEAICSDSSQMQEIISGGSELSTTDEDTSDINDESLTTGGEPVAEAEAVVTTSTDGNLLTLKCPIGEVGYVASASFGYPNGLCGCPAYMRPDATTGECPHERDLSVVPSACKPGEYCLLGTEPTLGTECCAGVRNSGGMADFSSIIPSQNTTCESTFSRDIVEGLCFGKKMCQININPYQIYNWTTKLSIDNSGVLTCDNELVVKTEDVPVLSTTGGKDKMEIRKYCAASFAQTRKKNPDNFPNLNKCLNNTATGQKMKLIVVATCFETKVNLEELGSLGFSTIYSKQYLQFVMSGLDMVATIIFMMFFFCLRKSEAKLVDKIDEAVIDVKDFTVFFPHLPPNKYKDHNELRHEIRDRLELNLEKGFKQNLTSSGPSTRDGSIHIHQIKLGFNHSRLINIMKRRGKILRRMELELNKESEAHEQHKAKLEDKMHKKLEKEIKKLAKVDNEISALEETTSAVCAFITFEDEEGVARALDMYPNTCCHRIGCCMKNDQKLEFEGKYYPFAFREPKGPTEVIWENCEVTPKQRCTRSMITSSLSLLLILSTFIFVVAAKNQKAAVDRLYPPTICDPLTPPTKKQVIADEFFADPSYNVTSKQGHLACYCQKLIDDAGPMQEENVYNSEFPKNPKTGSTTWCVDWVQGQAQVQGFAFLAVAMVVAVNTVLTMIMRRLVIYEKHPFITDMFSSLTTKIFIAKFLNTAIVVVIVNATLETYNVNIESPHFPLLAGAYNDFNMRWYFYVGAPIIMTVCMNSVTELSMPFALKAYQYYKIYKDRNKSGNKTISKKETQHDYDKLFIGGNFLLADQYASCLNTIFVVFLYSGGMPVLIFIACLIFYLKYKIEKWAFLRFYKTPPAYDESIAKNAQGWLPYAGVLHLLFATWMFTNPEIFGAGDTTSFSKMADAFFGVLGARTDSQANLAQASAAGGSLIFDRALLAPHLVYLAALIFAWLFFERVIWKLMVTFLSTIFPCLRCDNSGTKTETDDDSMSYSEAKREKQLKGIPDYNMEHNPAYIEMFALDVVSAHKFIRRIGKPAVDYTKMERKHYRGQRESLDKETLEREMEQEKHLEAVKARRQAKLPDKFQANPMTQQNPMHTSGRGRGRGRSSGSPDYRLPRPIRRSASRARPSKRGRGGGSGRGRGRGRLSMRGRGRGRGK